MTTPTNERLRICLDMDEVVADWLGMAREIVGHDFTPGVMLPHDQWMKVRAEKRMFAKLAVRPGGHELVEWVTAYAQAHGADLVFLTAIPHSNDVPFAYYDKCMWATKHFPHIPVLFGPHSYEKLYHCKPGDLLIDDRHDNIEQWNSRGGRGHIYTTWENCKPWLEETLQWTR